MSVKLDRLGHIFTEAISKIINEEVKDDDIKFVTITAVEITNDLSYAKVYFTNLIDTDREKVTKALNRASSFIRGKLFDEVEIRKMPELTFVYDESIEYGNKIEHIIEQIHDKIESMVFAGDVKSSSNLVITNSRHKDALFKAYNSINDAVDGIEQRLPYDFIEVDFKNIWDYLGYINGDTVQEDLLDTIFSNFCIGK